MIYHTGFFMKPVFAKAAPTRAAWRMPKARCARAARGADRGRRRPGQAGADRRGAAIGRAILMPACACAKASTTRWSNAEGDTTLQGTRLLQAGEVDALICGMQGSYDSHLAHVQREIGLAPGAGVLAAMNALVLDKLTLFITDTYVNDQPTAEELARSRAWRPSELRQFGLEPKVALLSHSSRFLRAAVGAAHARSARAAGAQSAPELLA
jgi:malate dehydrogenase (oxaloacetate-decarboxylating)(NADP+)